MRCRNCKTGWYVPVALSKRNKRGDNCDMICSTCRDSLGERLARGRVKK